MINVSLCFFTVIVFWQISFADVISGLHYRTFGDRKNHSIVFLHGGPDYNSHDFEITTAPFLASQGYFVVTYDQRGQGRSLTAVQHEYTYKQYADNLKFLIEALKLNKPLLIAHSHGGSIAVHMLKIYPELIGNIALVSAPLNWQALSSAVITNCKLNYTSTNNLEYLESLKTFVEIPSGHSSELSFEEMKNMVSWTFIHASVCGAYTVTNPSPHQLVLQARLSRNPSKGIVTRNSGESMPGFVANEDYFRQNLIPYVAKNSERFCGIYGEQDGLFDDSSLTELETAIGAERFALISAASHAPYMESQSEFFNKIKTVCNSK